MIVVGGLGPIGLAAIGAGDPVGEGVGPHVPLQQRAQREPAPTQLTLKQQSTLSSIADPDPVSGAWIRDAGRVKKIGPGSGIRIR